MEVRLLYEFVFNHNFQWRKNWLTNKTDIQKTIGQFIAILLDKYNEVIQSTQVKSDQYKKNRNEKTKKTKYKFSDTDIESAYFMR